MADLTELLREHLARRPQAQVQDAVKFIYQGEFGGGHLIKDEGAALERLAEEIGEGPSPEEPLSEKLGGGLSRLNLGAAGERLSLDTIFAMFKLSSAPRGCMEVFQDKLAAVYDTDLPYNEAREYIDGYIKAGCPMVSHSQQYRDAYHPRYRVVLDIFPWAIKLFQVVDELILQGQKRIVVGIDGMCASGKSTLAGLMAQVYGAQLYRADDYFLPPEKRTAERLSQPGGNMERERLLSEVLLPLSQGQRPVTRRFNCGDFTLSQPQEHPVAQVNILEGSYCLHPQLRPYYDVTAALFTDPAVQLERLSRRDPDKLGAFIRRWIPLENAYFEAFSLFHNTDVLLRS